MFNPVSKKNRIYCLGILLTILPCNIAYATLSGSLSPEAISERLSPYAKADVEGASAAKEQSTAVATGPEQIYKKNCAMCHDIGLAGAPKKGNKNDWAPRLAQGMATILKHAVNGYKAMPPKGNCLNCSEDDLHQTIEFMIK